MQQVSSIQKDIVLIGGGHSHLAVIRAFGMRPEPGVRITVVSKDIRTPYSGMMPGLIRGKYTSDQGYIDLNRLTRWANSNLILENAIKIDPVAQEVIFENRPPISYDILSINIGSTPPELPTSSASDYALPIKPINKFLDRLSQYEAEQHQNPRIAIAGAGAGGIETALALKDYFDSRGTSSSISILSDDNTILPGHANSVRNRMKRVLAEKGIKTRFNSKAIATDGSQVTLATGEKISADIFILATGAAVPSWLASSGFKTDKNGFIKVNEFLQSLSHPKVFAAGDCAAFTSKILPKSGVYAVRQGPTLARNLRRAALNLPLEKWKPQTRTLAVMATGNGSAIASYSKLSFSGNWVWKWKDALDQRWIKKYQSLPEMKINPPNTNHNQQVSLAMRCGGCGAKVASPILRRVLRRLGLANVTGDDAAIILPPDSKVLLQTVDHFRDFVGDPYLFGEIATNHALSDIYAMGAKPSSALVTAILPYAGERVTERDLLQLLAGVQVSLERAGAVLLGGHTGEGAELALGLSVNGFASEQTLARKGDAEPGDKIILTKPIGIGAILAANMRALAEANDFTEALVEMKTSNDKAASILTDCGANALTDVTGFGLAGHLIEMADAAELTAQIQGMLIPMLQGGVKAVENGIESTMAEANAVFASRISGFTNTTTHRLLLDPQTSGGLLAAVPNEKADDALTALHASNYRHATIIGTFTENFKSKPIQLN